MRVNPTKEPEHSPADRSAAEQLLAVRAYHQRTKHLPGRFAPGPGYLDWASQPDPFRRFAGARVIRLPLVQHEKSVLFSSLVRPGAVSSRPVNLDSLGLFLELSLGLTAWKEFQGTRSNSRSALLHGRNSRARDGPYVAIHPAVTCTRPRVMSCCRPLPVCRPRPGCTTTPLASMRLRSAAFCPISLGRHSRGRLPRPVSSWGCLRCIGAKLGNMANEHIDIVSMMQATP